MDARQRKTIVAVLRQARRPDLAEIVAKAVEARPPMDPKDKAKEAALNKATDAAFKVLNKAFRLVERNQILYALDDLSEQNWE